MRPVGAMPSAELPGAGWFSPRSRPSPGGRAPPQPQARWYSLRRDQARGLGSARRQLPHRDYGLPAWNLSRSLAIALAKSCPDHVDASPRDQHGPH